METIRNYLEAMFANMPNTAEILKAKDELWQMMEDNYEELIAQGKTENEAVGTVIAEFGNLNDLELNLGHEEAGTVAQIVQNIEQNDKRLINTEEAKAFLVNNGKRALYVGLGVLLCIACPIGPIMAGGVGTILLLLMIAGAVILFVTGGTRMNGFEFVRKNVSMLDYAATNYVSDECAKYKNTHHSLRLTTGILCCVFCWMPAALLDILELNHIQFIDDFSAVLLFLLAGFGVFLIVYTSVTLGGYENLLNLNDIKTVSGHYKDREPEYKSKAAKTVMEVFWPTITCIYLAWSFLSFDWTISWIIWPVAAIVSCILRAILTKND